MSGLQVRPDCGGFEQELIFADVRIVTLQTSAVAHLSVRFCREVFHLVALKAKLRATLHEQGLLVGFMRAVTSKAISRDAVLELRLFEKVVVALEAHRLTRFGQEKLVRRRVRCMTQKAFAVFNRLVRE